MRGAGVQEKQSRHALVVGAAGALGAAIVRDLLARGWRVTAATRRPELAGALAGAGAGLIQADLDRPETYQPALVDKGITAALLTPILTHSLRLLPLLREAGVARLVAFSSHNVTVDARSSTYAALRAAEAELAQSGCDWTLLRPTMIYGAASLEGMAGLLRLARRAPLLPTPWPGAALQQPIHLEDLARVAAWLAGQPDRSGQAVDLGGPDIVPLRQLYALASRAAGGWGVTLPVPTLALRAGARLLGRRSPLSLDQIARLDSDKHVPKPPDLPEEARPRIRLAEGLNRLAEELHT